MTSNAVPPSVLYGDIYSARSPTDGILGNPWGLHDPDDYVIVSPTAASKAVSATGQVHVRHLAPPQTGKQELGPQVVNKSLPGLPPASDSSAAPSPLLSTSPAPHQWLPQIGRASSLASLLEQREGLGQFMNTHSTANRHGPAPAPSSPSTMVTPSQQPSSAVYRPSQADASAEPSAQDSALSRVGSNASQTAAGGNPVQRYPPQAGWTLQESHVSEPLHLTNRHRKSPSPSSAAQRWFGFDKETGLPKPNGGPAPPPAMMRRQEALHQPRASGSGAAGASSESAGRLAPGQSLSRFDSTSTDPTSGDEGAARKAKYSLFSGLHDRIGAIADGHSENPPDGAALDAETPTGGHRSRGSLFGVRNGEQAAPGPSDTSGDRTRLASTTTQRISSPGGQQAKPARAAMPENDEGVRDRLQRTVARTQEPFQNARSAGLGPSADKRPAASATRPARSGSFPRSAPTPPILQTKQAHVVNVDANLRRKASGGEGFLSKLKNRSQALGSKAAGAFQSRQDTTVLGSGQPLPYERPPTGDKSHPFMRPPSRGNNFVNTSNNGVQPGSVVAARLGLGTRAHQPHPSDASVSLPTPMGSPLSDQLQSQPYPAADRQARYSNTTAESAANSASASGSQHTSSATTTSPLPDGTSLRTLTPPLHDSEARKISASLTRRPAPPVSPPRNHLLADELLQAQNHHLRSDEAPRRGDKGRTIQAFDKTRKNSSEDSDTSLVQLNRILVGMLDRGLSPGRSSTSLTLPAHDSQEIRRSGSVVSAANPGDSPPGSATVAPEPDQKRTYQPPAARPDGRQAVSSSGSGQASRPTDPGALPSKVQRQFGTDPQQATRPTMSGIPIPPEKDCNAMPKSSKTAKASGQGSVAQRKPERGFKAAILRAFMRGPKRSTDPAAISNAASRSVTSSSQARTDTSLAMTWHQPVTSSPLRPSAGQQVQAPPAQHQLPPPPHLVSQAPAQTQAYLQQQQQHQQLQLQQQQQRQIYLQANAQTQGTPIASRRKPSTDEPQYAQVPIPRGYTYVRGEGRFNPALYTIPDFSVGGQPTQSGAINARESSPRSAQNAHRALMNGQPIQTPTIPSPPAVAPSQNGSLTQQAAPQPAPLQTNLLQPPRTFKPIVETSPDKSTLNMSMSQSPLSEVSSRSGRGVPAQSLSPQSQVSLAPVGTDAGVGVAPGPTPVSPPMPSGSPPAFHQQLADVPTRTVSPDVSSRAASPQIASAAHTPGHPQRGVSAAPVDAEENIYDATPRGSLSEPLKPKQDLQAQVERAEAKDEQKSPALMLRTKFARPESNRQPTPPVTSTEEQVAPTPPPTLPTVPLAAPTPASASASLEPDSAERVAASAPVSPPVPFGARLAPQPSKAGPPVLPASIPATAEGRDAENAVPPPASVAAKDSKPAVGKENEKGSKEKEKGEEESKLNHSPFEPVRPTGPITTTSADLFVEAKRRQMLQDQEEKIALFPEEPGQAGGPSGWKKPAEEELKMTATSYPGQEWNPYGDEGLEEWE